MCITSEAHTPSLYLVGIYPEPHSLPPSPLRLPLTHSLVGIMTGYTITDRDEYGVDHAVLTFESPEHARDYLRGLLAQTDNTTIEMALQGALDEVELDCHTPEESEAPSWPS